VKMLRRNNELRQQLQRITGIDVVVLFLLLLISSVCFYTLFIALSLSLARVTFSTSSGNYEFIPEAKAFAKRLTEEEMEKQKKATTGYCFVFLSPSLSLSLSLSRSHLSLFTLVFVTIFQRMLFVIFVTLLLTWRTWRRWRERKKREMRRKKGGKRSNFLRIYCKWTQMM